VKKLIADDAIWIAHAAGKRHSSNSELHWLSHKSFCTVKRL